jgi:hypothetical protein
LFEQFVGKLAIIAFLTSSSSVQILTGVELSCM